MNWPAKSSYPNTVLIVDAVWEVKFVRKIASANHLGLCDPSTNTIYIRLKQSREETFLTFFHECMHAYEFETGKEAGETMVRLFEGWLGMLLRDNF